MPALPLGVMVTVMTPVPPGDRSIGVNGGGVARTDDSHTSPVDEVTAASNSLVSTLVVKLAVAAGVPAEPNGPSSTADSRHGPGWTCGATIAAVAVRPAPAAAMTSGESVMASRSNSTGAVAVALAANATVSVGTR